MAAITIPGMFLTGVHGSRPSSGVGVGTLYACSTHSLIYQTTDTGSTWVTWATLGTGTGSGTLTTVKDEGSNLSTAAVSIDFVGAGVTATNSTTAITVTIPGSAVIPNTFVKRTAGDLSITDDTSYHDVPTIGDLSIAAATGDILRLTLGAVADNAMRYEVQFPTSGNYAGPGITSTQGIASWANRVAGAGNSNGSILYTVVSGDIATGAVLCRLRYSTNASGATKIFASTGVGPLFFSVENLKH